MRRVPVIILTLVTAYLIFACSTLPEREPPSVPDAPRTVTDTPIPIATDVRPTAYTVTAIPISTHKPTTAALDTSTFQTLQDFPLEVGATWVYSVTFVSGGWHGEDLEDAEFMEFRSTGLITETVIGRSKIANDLVFTSTLSGILTETIKPWGQITATAISTTTEEYPPDSPFALRGWSYKVTNESIYRNNLEILRKPLTLGQQWAPFGEKVLENAAEGWYVWHVKEQRDLMTRAGLFQGCLYLVLWTAPDHSLNWFCPGVGFVYKEYHHHGTPHDQYWELQSKQ